MAREAIRHNERNRILVSAGWVASAAVVLVEMQFGMDYVLSQVAAQLTAFAGWLPVVGVLLKQFWA